MAVNTENYLKIQEALAKNRVTLVAVSKTKPVEDIEGLYRLNQRDFGENYVQELCSKYEQLPKDIRWHFIGHLQTNKVKYIAPFVYLIHGADSAKLLAEINKQAGKLGKTISCLLQVHIAQEETKFGFDEAELEQVNPASYPHLHIRGMMGMASFTEDMDVVRTEFRYLAELFGKYKNLFQPGMPPILSMGMSGDYPVALEEGSNMVRIGSLLFGARNYGG